MPSSSRTMFAAAATIAILGLAAPQTPADASCRHRDTLEASLPADGVTSAAIRSYAGDLDIVGRDGLTTVEVRGTACAGDADDLARIALGAEVRGDRIVIDPELPELSSWGRNNYAYLDLVIEVPRHLALDVNDGSGDIDIRGVGALELEDGSGDIEIEDTDGSVEIVDGSGDLDVRDARGEVRIQDGSGDVEIDRVGALWIEEDGSGDIRVATVGGDVMVERDGSGSIRARDVGGDFTVERDGSGDVDYRDIAGRVSVPSDR